MADKTIGELQNVQAVSIGELQQVTKLFGDSLIPVEQQGTAMHMTGEQFADFARESVEPSTEAAQGAQKAAETARDTAKKYMDAAGKNASAATESAEEAARSRKAIEDMTVTAYTLPAGSEASAVKSTAGESFNLRLGIPRGEQGAIGPQGPQGIQGPQGPAGTGVAVSAQGTYAFNVNAEGHLILHYTGEEAPDFTIRDDGHLYLNI